MPQESLALAAALVDAPQPSFQQDTTLASSSLQNSRYLPVEMFDAVALGNPHTEHFPAIEPFHWKGLLLQSFAFEMLQNATRIMTADQNDRHILLNKPFWSNYWASLGQFNMRRWNDGDNIKVNYIGHPMQGAISGYIQVQNDPRGRNLRISRNPLYWKSRYHAFLWELVYSTQWEIGPLGETAIFNQGGFTYPIRCNKHPGTPNYCENPNTMYTNNTGWVDFIITPVVGTLWLLGEDTIDRFISDPLVQHHPNGFGYKVIRSSLNPPRSLANMLRGHYPWWRDYEHPGEYESPIHEQFVHFLSERPVEHADFSLHYSALGLQTNHTSCTNCRQTATGAGLEVGVRLRRYLDFTSEVSIYPQASPVSSLNKGGTLTTATFGVRSGYTGKRYALKVGLAPGFASYSRTGTDSSSLKRNYNFAAAATLSGDLRLTDHFGFRATAVQMLIRYKSSERDPDGIGTPPRLSFLSHDNYINSTNWGVQVGPVFRF
ncbi:MAG TPA: hypothetical protein VK593_01395 [Edaphobacter sp.]|nr:hypothetical protein [Edaphobacter sp.]